uniref:Protein kinase domain-containing protein n=1 Tax=Rhabditophanes sp. KR3021 TaxID=114890 RepID=A0AC35UFS6_9BILA
MKLKKEDISTPHGFQHRIHATYDPINCSYEGLPKQWLTILGLGKNNPKRKPIDPAKFTPYDLSHYKRIVWGDRSECGSRPESAVSKYNHSNMGSRNAFMASPSASPFRSPSTQYYKRCDSFRSPEAGRIVGTKVNVKSPSLRKCATEVNTSTRQDSKGNNGCPLSRKENASIGPIQQTKAMSDEEFKHSLECVVDKGDPRGAIKEFVQIGEGSTSLVFRGKFVASGATVAVKKMKLKGQQRRELLFNEVVLMRDFSHSNIVKIFNSYLVEEELWVVMEYMERGSLTEVVTQMRLEESVIALISAQILEGLAYLHRHQIVHRDIKSDSILFDKDGFVKISDFGFCAQLTVDRPKRKSLVGTPYWMPMEVILRQDYDTSVDIWAFGITVIEMVMGEPPHFAEDTIKALRKIIDSAEPTISSEFTVSGGLSNFISMCCRKKASERATAQQLSSHAFLTCRCDHNYLVSIFTKLFDTINNN